MALSNSQYDAIMREYGKRQMENQHSQEARKKEVYEKVPAVKELEAEIAERSVACARKLLEGSQDAIYELREKLADLKEQKALLIKAAGFPDDKIVSIFTAIQEAVPILGKPLIILKECVNRIFLFLQQVLDEDGGIAFTGAVRTMYPQAAARVRRFISKRLAEKVHQLFHVIADNILPPEILIATIGGNIHNRFKGGIYL